MICARFLLLRSKMSAWKSALVAANTCCDEASRFPQSGFIGVEPFVNGMAKMVGALNREPLHNLRLFDEDAALVLDWLPEASLSGIDLFYPDPWHKAGITSAALSAPPILKR